MNDFIRITLLVTTSSLAILGLALVIYAASSSLTNATILKDLNARESLLAGRVSESEKQIRALILQKESMLKEYLELEPRVKHRMEELNSVQLEVSTLKKEFSHLKYNLSDIKKEWAYHYWQSRPNIGSLPSNADLLSGGIRSSQGPPIPPPPQYYID